MRVVPLSLLLCVACGAAEEPEPSPPCEQECLDAVALRSLRETMKLIYNLKLQGGPVGPQDAITPCPLGGTAHVFGEATSNSMQGSSIVSLTYELEGCAYLELDEEPDENYTMTLTGVITQEGTLAVQPTATTALLISSDSVTFSGSVYDPPVDYEEAQCEVVLGQDGHELSGMICGREAGVRL